MFCKNRVFLHYCKIKFYIVKHIFHIFFNEMKQMSRFDNNIFHLLVKILFVYLTLVENPQSFENLIKEKVDKLLDN